MNPRDVVIAYQRWVLHWTYQEIADKHEISRQRAHQVVKEVEDALLQIDKRLFRYPPVQPAP